MFEPVHKILVRTAYAGRKKRSRLVRAYAAYILKLCIYKGLGYHLDF